MLDPKTETMYSLMFSINLPFAPLVHQQVQLRKKNCIAGISSIEYEKSDMQREMTSQLKTALVKYNTAIDLTKLYNDKVIPLYRLKLLNHKSLLIKIIEQVLQL
ncbi:MAG: hypothetical protein MZV64_64670 [Ignavibacteriales bacterium]|nr:hypothetical protein [Ignavibacteriales bacterium]